MTAFKTLSAPVAPGGTIGILGGGQLGRMLAMAAARLGLRTHIYSDTEKAPAFQVSAGRSLAAYDDEAALAEFARACDAVTFEFENVPGQTAAFLARLVPVNPGPRALAISQERYEEKRFVAGLGLKTAPFAAIDSRDDIAKAIKAIGCPAVLKTRRMGYDGKGQVRLDAPDENAIRAALAAINHAPAILEGFVDFAREVSVIAARDRAGNVALFDIAENVHRDGILSTSTVPAAVFPQTAQAARAAAEKLLHALDYVGVLGLEFFVLADGSLLANEFAPRVHNSGHWTEAACAISQFEQHIRAVAGLPLGDTRRHSDCVMENLIDDDVEKVPAILRETDAVLHLYGKKEARPGRKMGHVTRIAPRTA